MKFVDRHWRLFGAALSFTVFGISGLIVGLVLFPLMFVVIRSPGARKVAARRLIGKAFGSFVWLVKTVGVMDCRIEGNENIATRPGQLIIANHPTLIDVVILLSLFPQANCVIKSAVTRNIFMRSTVRAADYISNSEPEEVLEACVDYLQSGGSLLLFPEGTRTIPGTPVTFKPGAAAIATRSQATLLPVAIECKPVFLTSNLPWHYVPAVKPIFTIRILPPVAMADLTRSRDTERHLRQHVNDAMLNIINRELKDMGADCQ